MTEKLYKEIEVLDNVIYLNGNIAGCERLCELLNRYDEDCNRYHEYALKAEKDKEELLEENKQLKKILHFLRNDNAESILNVLNTQQNEIVRLVEENEQLKETNRELYDFRLILNALLFNEWVETGKYEVYKSKRHHDGEPCFDGDWFIVVAILPSGQVTNHYHIKYWDYFKIPSYERVKDEFDGHTSSVVLLRYEKVI